MTAAPRLDLAKEEAIREQGVSTTACMYQPARVGHAAKGDLTTDPQLNWLAEHTRTYISTGSGGTS